LPVTQIHRPARLATRAASFRYGGRHHPGIPGGFIPFYPGDFIGIRSQLIKSGIPFALGVEPRQLTLFFSDLGNFSSHSETLAPADLLVQISTYLEEVSGAIAEEGGTVDKFIGDGVEAVGLLHALAG
jgi:hypothetical protein